MKSIQNPLILLLFLVIVLPYRSSAQTDELKYEVKQIYPAISITKEKLQKAQTLIDLNKYYKASWMKEYISVEVLAVHQGNTKKARSKNNTLTQEQKNIMNMADVNTEISVKVKYLPRHTISTKDVKEFNFTFTVDPENGAAFPGGQQELTQYLKENAIDNIFDGNFDPSVLAVVKFTINEEGKVINPSIFETSRDEEIDGLLLEAIRNMPTWKPAAYANGTKVTQNFVLTVGNMESCALNLLNIHRD